MITTKGIHHITAIAGNPQENLAFYQGVLGMRLVKKSINQDAPDTYHLFFADADGNPGTDLTFFPWPQMDRGKHGAGNWGEVSLSVPPGSLAYWKERFERFSVDHDEAETRFSEKVLPFRDPHGMQLALVEAELPETALYSSWKNSPVPQEHQINGLAGIRMTARNAENSSMFLSLSMGFRQKQEEHGWQRWTVGAGKSGQRIDIQHDPQAARGQWGVGSVHHVAWRGSDTEELELIRQQVISAHGNPTEHIDRFWFTSVYVREPGGALCEFATEGPGFAVDENPAALGEKLILPPWYEQQREQIEAGLIPLSSISTEEYR
ncbi:ring-cleaving dioxygenase [Spirochaeta dissipatitropha]